MDAQEIIDALKQDWSLRYGLAVMDISVKLDVGEVELRGFVLSENQKAEVVRCLTAAFPARKMRDEVRVLSDPSVKPLGFARIKNPAALKNRYVASVVLNEKVLRRITIDTLAVGTLVRILFSKEAQALIQTETLLLGWVDAANLSWMKETEGLGVWQRLKMPAPASVLIDSTRPQDILAAADNFLGAPYAWGKASKSGLDCSALTQLTFRTAGNIILPRHSWDQKRLGRAVSVSEARGGDLVFMLNKTNSRRHVGIYDDREPTAHIIHACLALGKVVKQPLAQVKRNYAVVEIKRLIEPL